MIDSKLDNSYARFTVGKKSEYFLISNSSVVFWLISCLEFSYRNPSKNENLSSFDSLRKEVISLIPNFTKINELPSFNEIVIDSSPAKFISQEVIIKDLDYFFTNAISRASKTMSECRQIRKGSKKTGTNNL